MENLPPCPQCKSEYTYPTGELMACPECFHEWSPSEAEAEVQAEAEEGQIIDSLGKVLQDGDTVVVVKDLPVKGAPKPVIKAGTKVKNIRLSDGDHNISCKIDGFGSMYLKSEYVKKA